MLVDESFMGWFWEDSKVLRMRVIAPIHDCIENVEVLVRGRR
jgi:hypothetical protein